MDYCLSSKNDSIIAKEGQTVKIKPGLYKIDKININNKYYVYQSRSMKKDLLKPKK